jgi:hypothetical protein
MTAMHGAWSWTPGMRVALAVAVASQLIYCKSKSPEVTNPVARRDRPIASSAPSSGDVDAGRDVATARPPTSAARFGLRTASKTRAASGTS